MNEKEMASIRRNNLASWMSARGMSRSDLADKIGSGRAYASLLFSPDRYFGEKAARNIEDKLRMPRGYLDTGPKTAMVSLDWSSPDSLDDEVFGLVRQTGIRVSADGNLESVAASRPPLPFSKDWLKASGVSDGGRLRFWRAANAGMEPFIRAGDCVMIDMGQVAIKDGEVYAIKHGHDIRLRRIFCTVDGGLLLHADNPSHPSETLAADSVERLQVVGRVIWRAG